MPAPRASARRASPDRNIHVPAPATRHAPAISHRPATLSSTKRENDISTSRFLHQLTFGGPKSWAVGRTENSRPPRLRVLGCLVRGFITRVVIRTAVLGVTLSATFDGPASQPTQGREACGRRGDPVAGDRRRRPPARGETTVERSRRTSPTAHRGPPQSSAARTLTRSRCLDPRSLGFLLALPDESLSSSRVRAFLSA
jgi:hypothetical protein